MNSLSLLCWLFSNIVTSFGILLAHSSYKISKTPNNYHQVTLHFWFALMVT